MTTNNKKICFIVCVNNDRMFNECMLYISRLYVPEGYEIDVLSIAEAASMTAGYNEGMNASDARYKVYLHQDTFIVDRYFLYEMLDIFKSDESIGMIGAVGTPLLSSDGCMWNSPRVWCSYCSDVTNIDGCEVHYKYDSYKLSTVSALDGHFIATQYDIPWREDLFSDFDFYDASQCMEFARKGYRIVVPKLDKPICVHDDGTILDLINYDKNRQIFLKEYEDILNRSPKLNLDYYNDDDVYSEGDIEDKVVELITVNEPEDYIESVFNNYSWSTFYHLTPIRRNILNWYPFKKDCDILEIGCGLGAITGMLCDVAESVTAVELSKRRATGALLRCRNKSNLEIIVGNLNDINFNKKYDYITLIGVLEYQGTCTDSDTPYTDFLKKIRSLLKPDGKLLIAIENRFGLKYWIGAREDHTGVSFDGINNYTVTDSKVRTFSRKDLRDLISCSGFKHSYFYYPLPDYKLPKVIYSEEYTPTDGIMHNMRPYYIPDCKGLIANELDLWSDIVENDSFEFFSNSFLVECSDDQTDSHITFALLNTERKKKYVTGTRFVSDKKVEKINLYTPDKYDHLDTIIKNEEALKKRGLNIICGKRSGDRIVYDYIKAPLLDEIIIDLIKANDISGVEAILDKVYADIIRSSEHVSAERNVILSLDIDPPSDPSLYGPILATAYIDMILRNAFMIEGKITWIDQEWALENMPANYVMYRLFKEFGIQHPDMNKEFMTFGKKYGIDDTYDIYGKVETKFFDSVIDRYLMTEYNAMVPG